MRAMSRVIRTGWRGFVGSFLALTLPAPDVSAYDTFGDGYGSKWDAPQFGTGAVVTWSYVTPGVGLASNPAIAHLSGSNTLGGGDPAWDIRSKIDAQFGAGAFDAAVQRALNTWAAAAHLHFVQVADSGANFAGSTTPDIRIGAFHFPVGDFAGGAAWGPPGDDLHFPDALAGDLALNDRNRFTIATGPEGSPLPTDGGIYLNDVEGLILHEIGHALGLGHSDVIERRHVRIRLPGRRLRRQRVRLQPRQPLPRGRRSRRHPGDLWLGGGTRPPVAGGGGVLAILLAAVGARASRWPRARRA